MNASRISQLAIEFNMSGTEVQVHLDIGEQMGRSSEQTVAAIKDWSIHHGRMPNTVTLNVIKS